MITMSFALGGYKDCLFSSCFTFIYIYIFGEVFHFWLIVLQSGWNMFFTRHLNPSRSWRFTPWIIQHCWKQSFPTPSHSQPNNNTLFGSEKSDLSKIGGVTSNWEFFKVTNWITSRLRLFLWHQPLCDHAFWIFRCQRSHLVRSEICFLPVSL